MTIVTLNGNDYSDNQGEAARHMSNGGHRDWLFPMLQDFLVDAGRNLTTTSTSSYTLGSGTGSVVMPAEIPFTAATYVILADATAPTTNFALCQITSRVGTTLNFIEAAVTGSGTKTSWTIQVSGPIGPTGATGGIAGGTLTGSIDANSNNITNIGVLDVTGDSTFGGASTFSGNTTFQGGDQFQQTDLGTVTTAQAIAQANDSFIKVTLGADVTFTFGLPTTGHGYSKLVKIVQDGTGGRVPTFQLSGPVTVIWIGDEPTWGSRTSGQSNYVTILVTPDGEIFASAFHGSA
jgi:hypothetical protein